MSEYFDGGLRRIGDAERDEAVSMLRDHMAAGRLDHAEFDERLGTALRARTQPELDQLFVDLPAPRPGHPTSTPAGPLPGAASWQPDPRQAMQPWQPPVDAMPQRRAPQPKPWWTHWGLILVAVLLSSMTHGRLGMLVPLVAVWCFWLGPSIANRRAEQRAFEEQEHQRQLGQWEHPER